MTLEKIRQSDKRLIVGIGSALVDFLIHAEDAFIEQAGGVKGGMTLVESGTIDKTVALAADKPEVVPGGSACNTVVGVGNLGGPGRFVGKRGSDALGDLLENGLKKNNVGPLLFQSPTPTGRVLSIITPDAQRTFLTFLGAAAEMSPDEVRGGCFKEAAVVHVEGYLLYNRELIMAVLEEARRAGACISLDLASFTVVEDAADILGDLVDQYVDILIANEDEARAFTGFSDEEQAIRALSERADLAVLKIGARGSRVAFEGQVTRIEPAGTGAAVDTTGAGDLWAAGFLYGLVNGFDLAKSGRLGSACGYEVCQVVGAGIPARGWDRIRTLI
ncbi:MAG: adenosine kinase [Desulfobacterales bacterium]|nr:adenosine kinase [Desulfobacterales bacterium]